MYWYAYAILVAALWGLYAIIESQIVKEFHPMFLFVIGGLCCGVCSLVLFFIKRNQLLPLFAKASAKTIIISIIGSFLALVVANYIFLLALEHAESPGIIMGLAYSAPIFTIIGSMLILQYKINMIELVGIGLTVCGVGVVAFGMGK